MRHQGVTDAVVGGRRIESGLVVEEPPPVAKAVQGGDVAAAQRQCPEPESPLGVEEGRDPVMEAADPGILEVAGASTGAPPRVVQREQRLQRAGDLVRAVPFAELRPLIAQLSLAAAHVGAGVSRRAGEELPPPPRQWKIGAVLVLPRMERQPASGRRPGERVQGGGPFPQIGPAEEIPPVGVAEEPIEDGIKDGRFGSGPGDEVEVVPGHPLSAQERHLHHRKETVLANRRRAQRGVADDRRTGPHLQDVQLSPRSELAPPRRQPGVAEEGDLRGRRGEELVPGSLRAEELVFADPTDGQHGVGPASARSSRRACTARLPAIPVTR